MAEKKKHRFHKFTVTGNPFTVDTHYTPLKPLGKGAYGLVCSALDTRTNQKVAIKKIPQAFEDMIDAKRILREIKLLRHFDHDNIIALTDLVPPQGKKYDDIYIVLDFMETDLHQIIHSKNELTDEHVQYFIYQILCGLKFIHSASVMHRDLKPSNLLLNSNCDLKICDFGLARGVEEAFDDTLTEYVVTRWYRAPEVMCACQEYDAKIDVWAVGCILAELLGRKPLFPGEDYIKQMNLIVDVLGTPNKEDMDFITNPQALQYIKSLPDKAKINFQKKYKHANPKAIDLLDKMLAFNPKKRISVDDALNHPYLSELRESDTSSHICPNHLDLKFEEVLAESRLKDPTNEKARKAFEKELKEYLYEEIYALRPEERARKAHRPM